MFDRFSDNAKKLMQHARLEAIRLQHEYIAPEHLLLGLLQLADGSAHTQLRQLGVDPASLRDALLAVVAPGRRPVTTTSQLPFTPGGKRVLEATLEAASSLRDVYIGSQHLLLGLAAVERELPSQVLAKLGVTAAKLRAAAEGLTAAQRGNVRLLLISNSTMHGGGYLEHCAHEIRDLLGPRKNVLFVPYALHDHDAYTAKARTVFETLGHDLTSVHEQQHSPRALDDAGAVFVGGGNTFRLLAALYHYQLLPAIRQRVAAGMPYIGSSAGTNVATASIRTTNDMPIVQPPSFTALQLVPFQINPHYLDPAPGSTHMGETREERLRQFHEEHCTPVLGMREGCMLRVDGDRAELRGTTSARLFRRGQPPQELTPPCDVSMLLRDDG
jgi:dipeptidase E